MDELLTAIPPDLLAKASPWLLGAFLFCSGLGWLLKHFAAAAIAADGRLFWLARVLDWAALNSKTALSIAKEAKLKSEIVQKTDQLNRALSLPPVKYVKELNGEE